MLTKHPNIVIALPPKRSRRKKAKAAPMLTQRIADHSKPLPPHDPEQARAAADRLWQDLVRSVNQAAPDQPAPGRKNSRTRSGQLRIAAFLNLRALPLRAIAHLRAHHLAHRHVRPVLGQQPGDTEPARALAPPAADFDHRRTTLGNVAQQDHITHHGLT